MIAVQEDQKHAAITNGYWQVHRSSCTPQITLAEWWHSNSSIYMVKYESSSSAPDYYTNKLVGINLIICS